MVAQEWIKITILLITKKLLKQNCLNNRIQQNEKYLEKK